MPENILVESNGPILTITLNRPKALNALSSALLTELDQQLDQLTDETRVVIITGSGEKAFAAGADIAEMRDYGPVEAERYSALGHRVFRRFETLPQVFIAALNGFTLGGGLELAMGCDLLYASENAKLGQPEVNLGVTPGYGGTQRLQRLVGPQLAREMLYTGDAIDAQTAKARGLVVDVLPREQLLEHVRKVAEKIASKGPLAIRATKNLVRRGQDLDLDSANLLEQQTFGLMFGTDDRREGMAAFLERRAPVFKGS